MPRRIVIDVSDGAISIETQGMCKVQILEIMELAIRQLKRMSSQEEHTRDVREEEVKETTEKREICKCREPKPVPRIDDAKQELYFMCVDCRKEVDKDSMVDHFLDQILKVMKK